MTKGEQIWAEAARETGVWTLALDDNPAISEKLREFGRAIIQAIDELVAEEGIPLGGSGGI